MISVASERHFLTRFQFSSLYIESKGKKDFMFWVVFFHNIKNFARLITKRRESDYGVEESSYVCLISEDGFQLCILNYFISA